MGRLVFLGKIVMVVVELGEDCYGCENFRKRRESSGRLGKEEFKYFWLHLIPFNLIAM